MNFLLFCVGATQVTRVLQYQSEMKGQTLGEELKDKAKDASNKVQEVAQDPAKLKEAVTGK